MNLSRNNHIVPRMYLKNWAVNDRIWVYNLLVSNSHIPFWTQKSVGGVAYYSDYYVRVENGKETDYFEREFSARFESPAKEPLSKIINNQKMTSNDWKYISKYVAAQYVRTPSFYQFVHDYLPDVIPGIIDSVSKDLSEASIYGEKAPKEWGVQRKSLGVPLEINITDKRADDNHTFVEVKTIVGKSMWLAGIQACLDPNSEVMNAFCKMKWSILSCPEGCVWPTSDNPVSVVEIGTRKIVEKGEGLAKKDTMILFPVSPKKALVGKTRNRFDYRIELSKNDFQELKKAIIKNAFLQVYSIEKDSDIPYIRRRVVDEAEYKRISEGFKNLHDMYKKQEVPLICQWEK